MEGIVSPDLVIGITHILHRGSKLVETLATSTGLEHLELYNQGNLEFSCSTPPGCPLITMSVEGLAGEKSVVPVFPVLP